LEIGGDDLRDLPLIDRKWRLAKLIGKAKKWRAIQYSEHLTGDGPTVFEHVCRMGLEGIVSKRTDAPYRSGPSKMWLKSEPGERSSAPGARGGVSLTSPGLHPAPSGGSPSGCTSGALALTGGGSSPASSLSLTAASISPAATAGSEVVFAILSSAAAASRAW
jgi:ATP dependent DNA ligase domain